jgi:rhamnogalacturonyl hydrolase YesR
MFRSQIGRSIDNLSEGGQWSCLLCSKGSNRPESSGTASFCVTLVKKPTSAEFTAIIVAKYQQNFSAD